ncbi:tyrosine-type recombinase/integrase [Aeromonas jandaei]|uniref:tyrosine-type recombinase/integrase n=1 Tax=Aeromonas jandaei TaxID=650 RepID=UPI00162AAA16|nr:site-specific integrase [Aeromonas jandaei]
MDGTLVDEHGMAFRPFSVYIGCLRRQGYAVNTINAYGQHVARFLNYVNQAVDVYSGELNINGWREIIGSYGDYLLYGVEANDFIARQIAQKNRRWRKTGIRSMGVIETAIIKYIELGELEQLNETDSYIHPMFPREYKKLTRFESTERKKRSFFGGLISASNQSEETSSSNTFEYHRKKSVYFQKRHFPYERITDFINAASCYRDKTLYALLAASGCRVHEALQLTLDNISITDFSIELADYRDNMTSFVGLTTNEIGKLAWKGRATNKTFLIEPYKSLFFKHLESYFRYERNGVVSHRYVFQNRHNARPYFSSSRQTLINSFRRNLIRAGINDTVGLSPHSLRHSYGRYTLNYLPLSDGSYGLPLVWVKILMGHSDISSTQIYAKSDEDFITSIVAYSNQTVFSNNPPSISEVQIRYFKDEIFRLVEQINKLEGDNNDD